MNLGLLFMYYLLKSRGSKNHLSWANVPVKDVAYVVNLKKPDIIFILILQHCIKFQF